MGSVPTSAPFVGADGLATLLLSLAVAGASLGVSFTFALARVLAAARRTGTELWDAEPRRILVLGARLGPDGAPGPAFRARLERAAALLAVLPRAEAVVLGGATRPGGPAEAEAGRRHLVERLGVPPGRVGIEASSRHTLENLRHYRAAFGADGGRVALVTSRSHAARAGAIATGLGIDHVVCAAEGDWRPGPAALARLLREAGLLHWYLVGSAFARLTRNRAMLARIR